jgi:hypothetical protein
MFAVLALWAFGVMDIDRHRRKGTSTSATLLCMACCVSLVAVLAVAGIGAAFSDPWVETVDSADPEGREAGQFPSPARTHLFSFGLENASYVPGDPTDENGVPR